MAAVWPLALETVTCCSAYAQDTSTVVRTASRKALVFSGFGSAFLASGMCLGFSGKHLEYRNVREFPNHAAGGKGLGKSGNNGGPA